MELFLIYLWLKLDTFAAAFVILSVVMVICWLLYWVVKSEIRYSDRDDWHSRNKYLLKRFLIVAITATFMAIFTPSQKDVAVLVGSHIGIQAIKSPEATKVWSLMRGKANQILDEQLEQLNKEVAK